MVRINRVYTKAGDTGTTCLIGGDRVSKASLRIESYGVVDELNAILGLVACALQESAARDRLESVVVRVQNELFNLGSQLATPSAERRAQMPRLEARHVEQLERDIDACNAGLAELKSFVLPGGGWVSAHFHHARTVCRRAERVVVALAEQTEIDSFNLIYLNRLSDACFVFGRFAASLDGCDEQLWDSRAT